MTQPESQFKTGIKSSWQKALGALLTWRTGSQQTKCLATKVLAIRAGQLMENQIRLTLTLTLTAMERFF